MRLEDSVRTVHLKRLFGRPTRRGQTNGILPFMYSKRKEMCARLCCTCVCVACVVPVLCHCCPCLYLSLSLCPLCRPVQSPLSVILVA